LPIVTSHTYCSTIICYPLVTFNQSHLLSTSLAFRSICFQVSLDLATLALQPHLLSGQFVIRSHLILPHLLSSLTCYQVNLLSGLAWFCHTCSPASLAIRSIYYQVSLDLATLALQPHACYQVNVLLGLTCYQNVCSPVSTVIKAHLLFKSIVTI